MGFNLIRPIVVAPRTYDAIVAPSLADGDYTSIQSALNAGKKSIFIKDGTYSEAITIASDNVTLVGESLAAFIDGNLSTSGTVNGGTLDNLKLKNTLIGWFSNKVSNWKIENCITTSGFTIYGLNSNLVFNNNFYSADIRGTCTFNSNTVEVSGFYLIDAINSVVTGNIVKKGETLYNCTDLIFTDNVVNIAGNFYISLCTNVIFDNNTIDGQLNANSRLYINATSSDIDITNNYFKDCLWWGIEIATSSSKIRIKNNKIYNSYGIYGSGISECIIESNIIDNAPDTLAYHGIELVGTCNNNSVRNNTIKNINTGYYGITLGDGNKNDISHNRFLNVVSTYEIQNNGTNTQLIGNIY